MRILVNVRSDGKMNQFLYFTNLNGIMFYQKKKIIQLFTPYSLDLAVPFAACYKK